MDEILYLEPDEEITSVIDKLKQSKAKRLSLVVPREATLLQSVVNLRLLMKEASNLGKEIALVTSDKIGRNLASKVGLVVFESVKNQQPVFQPPPPVPSREEIIEISAVPKETPKEIRPKGVQVHHFQEMERQRPAPKAKLSTPAAWQPPSKIKKDIDWHNLRKVIWPLLAVVVLLILIGAFLIFPKVGVQLKVKAESFQKNTDSQISATEPTTLENKLFTGKLIDINQEKEEKFSTTGKKNLGGKASGTLTFYNKLDSSSHSFNAGTKLSSSSKTFILKNNLVIPGATVQFPNIVPGTVNAEIEAESPGDDYNVKAGRFTIIGLAANQQEAIYGQSTKDLTGGFSKEVQVVSQEDYDKAKTKLTTELNDGLKKDLNDQLNGLEVIDNAIQIDIASEESSAKVDQEAQDFNLKIKERLRVMVFNREDFDKFILTILEKQIPSDKMISLGLNDTISPQIKEKKYDENLLNLEVVVSAKLSSKIDTEKVKENLLGKNRLASENYLKGIDGLSGFEINFFPSWWPLKRLPNYKKNLTVTLDYLEPEVNTSPTPSPATSPTSEATP